MNRVIVCGDRNWKDKQYIFDRLDDMVHYYGEFHVIEGCARGADKVAEEWAEARKVSISHFPADWQHLGKAAGVVRNQNMLIMGRPTMVIAFHTNLMDSKGTKDMVTRARNAGIQTFVFPHHE